MTDYTKLIERAQEQRDRDAAEHCPAEIIALQNEVIAGLEALQAEDERLKVNIAACSNEYAQLEAENERLENEVLVRRGMARLANGERDAMQAKLDELQRQEPVEYQSFTKPGFISCSPASWEPCTHEQYQDYLSEGTPVRKLYAAPKAQEPLPIEQVANIADGFNVGLFDYLKFARAIEAAHGITKNNQG